MTKKTIISSLLSLLFIASFFMTWVDYKVQPDLSGVDFLIQTRYFILGIASAAILLALLGQYSVISGLCVFLFLAQIFYGSSKNLPLLSAGFYISLAMTASLGCLFLTFKNNDGRNIILKLRRKPLELNHLPEEDHSDLNG
ncbi:MAG: hypothetical protein WAV55_12720 [Clostridiaceae bacterium]